MKKLSKLSIIIPIYNEENTLELLLNKVKKVRLPLEKEIVVVDDGSEDSSGRILKSFKDKNKDVVLVFHKKNKGKGAAIKTGLKNCTGDIIVIQDADLEYDPEQIPSLIKPILENESEVVYGSRFIRRDNQNWKIPHHYIGNRIISLLASLLYGCYLTDIETCYKAFNKKVKDSINIESDDFGFEIEFTAEVCKKRFKIRELPIRYTSRLWRQGKKITWRDGIKALGYLIKYKIKS